MDSSDGLVSTRIHKHTNTHMLTLTPTYIKIQALKYITYPHNQDLCKYLDLAHSYTTYCALANTRARARTSELDSNEYSRQFFSPSYAFCMCCCICSTLHIFSICGVNFFINVTQCNGPPTANESSTKMMGCLQRGQRGIGNAREIIRV